MINKRPYAQYRSNGKLWKAGKGILDLCAAYNHATNPVLPMTDFDHKRSWQYAKAIKNRMSRLGFVQGHDWIELSNGEKWPLNRERKNNKWKAALALAEGKGE